MNPLQRMCLLGMGILLAVSVGVAIAVAREADSNARLARSAVVEVDRLSAERGRNRIREQVQTATAGCRRNQKVRGALLVAAELTRDRTRRTLYERTLEIVDCHKSSVKRRSVLLTPQQRARYLRQIRDGRPLTYNP